MSRSFYRIVNNTVVKTMVQSITYFHGHFFFCADACLRGFMGVFMGVFGTSAYTFRSFHTSQS